MADLGHWDLQDHGGALVKKVNSAIKDEAEKLKIVERDIVFIKDEFEMMQSFSTLQGTNNTSPLSSCRGYRGMLKNRAEQVNQRNVRYSLVNNSEEQVLRTSAASQRILDFLMKPRDAFDDQNEILNLTELIKTEDKGLQVISVCGTEWLARKETSGEQEPDVGASQKEEADVGAVLATMDATQDSIIHKFPMDIIKKKPYLIVLEDLRAS
ncbi:hypothetical protein HU200_013315 [Digitaria exilis]|uniref:Uncharacterized protein n=1 Tax=Digitaria exilis TaxID=1010633 RepID=A0A835FDB4_9POAL|nr:hypothetical protein HU200_013315 [Digitaria exilis]